MTITASPAAVVEAIKDAELFLPFNVVQPSGHTTVVNLPVNGDAARDFLRAYLKANMEASFSKPVEGMEVDLKQFAILAVVEATGLPEDSEPETPKV